MSCAIQSPFFFKLFFAKIKHYNTNISSITFIYNTISHICGVFCSLAKMWSYSSIAPRRKNYLNVSFNEAFLHWWYCVIIGTILIIAHRLCRPFGGVVLCPESWVKWGCMLHSGEVWAHLLGEMNWVSWEQGMAGKTVSSSISRGTRTEWTQHTRSKLPTNHSLSVVDSNLIALWSEKMLDSISLFLNLLRFELWSKM